ncbi:hypothetical protein [Tropicimonas isoalkanivorans]|uniref:hypothetical protein n=1 Tax=Tropicimonas isoalkanivorans TaxID=441112 RepID=UPI0015A5B6B1|nr:hypothetical protein [Tropicimonas isoalkanivorans]
MGTLVMGTWPVLGRIAIGRREMKSSRAADRDTFWRRPVEMERVKGIEPSS